MIDPNDASGIRGNDNRGSPQAGTLAWPSVTLNASGEGITNFTVTFQPGDNFRVAALLDGTNAQAHLDRLQVTNAAGPFYVQPNSNPVPGFVGSISAMLTVWRKLHLEVDSMGAPPGIGFDTVFVSGTVTTFTPNAPSTGKSRVRIRHVVGGGSDIGLYTNGVLEVDGVGTYKVIGSETKPGISDSLTTVEIDGIPANIPSNTQVKLYDDDDRYLTNHTLYPSVVGLQSPPLPAFHHINPFIATNQHKFADAYIVVLNANTEAFSTGDTIPFKRHSEISDLNVGTHQLENADKPQFWAYSLTFAYQWLASEDGEPDSEVRTYGESQKSLGGLFHAHSGVFLEAIRDEVCNEKPGSLFLNELNAESIRRQYREGMYATMAHEIGHAPGGQSEKTDHQELGLMGRGFDRYRQPFLPATIRRFRQANQWTR